MGYGWGLGFGFGGMFGWSVCGVGKCFIMLGGGFGWRELATFRIPIRFLDLNLSPTLNLLKLEKPLESLENFRSLQSYLLLTLM